MFEQVSSNGHQMSLVREDGVGEGFPGLDVLARQDWDGGPRVLCRGRGEGLHK